MKELFGNTPPSVIENPFEKECITGICMNASTLIITGKWYIRGYVEFKKGDTAGKQSFEADSLDELYIKIANFCNTL